MNHYQLYKMIYGRILEATCSIFSVLFFIGACMLRGNTEAWFLWAIGVFYAVLWCAVTRSVKAFEDNLNIDE